MFQSINASSKKFGLFIILMTCSLEMSEGVDEAVKFNEINFGELGEHSVVTESAVFPFVAAILKMSTYFSAGALISTEWVLTAADGLFTLRESIRTIRIRLGSINYKKGGLLLPVKYIEVHPSFDDRSPAFDLALFRLANPVRFNPSLRPIGLLQKRKDADATHFIVPSWPLPVAHSDELNHLKSMDTIKRMRILSVTHLHPSDPEDCTEELTAIGINATESIMCLDTGVMLEPCSRDVGAPVVLNDVLWGIISSWRPENCENGLAGPTFTNLVSDPAISSWIHAIINGRQYYFEDY